jgi:hypothetical protein
MTDEIRASAIAQQPTGRLGTPNDTANLVRFLLPSKASGLMANSCTATVATPKAGSPSDDRATRCCGLEAGWTGRVGDISVSEGKAQRAVMAAGRPFTETSGSGRSRPS